MVYLFCKMLRGNKYRIKPTEAQKQKLIQSMGCARFVYNYGLNRKSEYYAETGETLSCFDLSKEITQLKKSAEHSWLKESHSQVLQTSLRNLDNAYTNFFNQKAEFPKFKKKSREQTIQYPQGVKIEGNKIWLPKIGWVKIHLSRPVEGKIKTVTVRMTSTGKFFVGVLVDNSKELPEPLPVKEETTVGLDFGIKDLVITSDGQVFKNHKYLDKMKTKLRKEQRSLSRKKKGSNNYEKQRLRVAKLHEKVANQRLDYLHKISRELVDSFDTICIEDLAVKDLLERKQMSKLIADAAWSELRRQLEYKCKWEGKNLITIGRFDPSSKRCSNCGNINRELKLRHREWTCQKCNIKHDRDINAALNIKLYGLGHNPRHLT